jgi:hypothetical protein
VTTFKHLGIPFPLFDAPSEQSVEYVGVGECSLCQSNGHCFELAIGCGVMINCPGCGSENGLDADDRCNQECRACACLVPFPAMNDGDPIVTCYGCLRAGRAAITKDTQYGMVSWEQAYAGVTHGVPGLRTSELPLVDGDDGWRSAAIPSHVLFELLRTPTPSTIQGETWQFCCRYPMVFVGSWDRAEFARRAHDGNESTHMDRLLGKHVPGLWEDALHDTTGLYVYGCSVCGRETATWDIA